MEHWDRFYRSGRIEDYLRYCREEREVEQDADLEGSCHKRERQG